MAIKNVIFDLGGVLLEWKPHEVLARWSPVVEKQRLIRGAVMGTSDWIAFDRGELSESEVIGRIQARTGLTAEEVTRFLNTVRDSLIAVPDAVALLQEAKGHGAALYCLSNMPTSVFSHVHRRYTFWNQFEGVVVSGEVRMVKPERAIFEHVLSRHRLKPHETLFVDDLPENIDAARQVGIDGFVFTGAAQCRKVLVAKLRPQ